MSVRVAVSDPLPLFRQGVLGCLDDVLIEPEAPSDLVSWARNPDRRVILLTVMAAADWKLLADLCDVRPEVVIVVLLADVSVASYLRAISAGAAGAMPRAGSGTQLRAVFEAAVAGDALLPAEVVRALARGGPEAQTSADHPTAKEISWLRDLADGVSVARIAEHSDYSERMMFRLLRALYQRLGAANRREALKLARDREWI